MGRERFARKKAPCCMFETLLDRKICTTLWRENNFRKNKAPHCMLGALLEVELRKICTALWRESHLEVKIAKIWRSRDVFGGSNCVLHGRRRDAGTLQNTWQAQEFVRVARALAGVVDFKKVRKDVFCAVGAGRSGFVMSMFEASDAESVEGLQSSCHGFVSWKCCSAGIISRGSYRSWFVCLGSTFSWQAQYFISWTQFHWIKKRMLYSTSQLNLKANDSQSHWISTQLNLKIEIEIIWTHITWISNHLNTWIPNQWLTIKSLETSIDNQSTWNSNPLYIIHWISNQMTCKTIESEINWLSNQLNSTPSSYRFLIFGNFRHHLVR